MFFLSFSFCRKLHIVIKKMTQINIILFRKAYCSIFKLKLGPMSEPFFWKYFFVTIRTAVNDHVLRFLIIMFSSWFNNTFLTWLLKKKAYVLIAKRPHSFVSPNRFIYSENVLWVDMAFSRFTTLVNLCFNLTASFTSSEVPSNGNISTYNPVIQGICLSSNNVVFLLANFEKYNGYLLLLKAVITSYFSIDLFCAICINLS